ncbi:MAG TPA: hypothetical protein VED24_04175 [Candidatus Acidoferrum sp.]|nr:hypothetical protein [Candidatus Acidoferrum sp.]
MKKYGIVLLLVGVVLVLFVLLPVVTLHNACPMICVPGQRCPNPNPTPCIGDQASLSYMLFGFGAVWNPDTSTYGFVW